MPIVITHEMASLPIEPENNLRLSQVMGQNRIVVALYFNLSRSAREIHKEMANRLEAGTDTPRVGVIDLKTELTG